MSNFYVLAPIPEVTVKQPKIEKGLPYSIRSNCYAYVKSRFPSLPGTDYILSHLSDHGEVAVFYYPDSGLHHYAVVDSLDPFIVTDTNYGSDSLKTRKETKRYLIGFFAVE